jgi:ligand-binding sensor domain-containing protein/DNA-binding CsgD family transcriptional regulator
MKRRTAVPPLILFLLAGSRLIADSFPGRFFRFERLAPRTETISMVGISSVCQDNEGFLWLGTSAGLARYDGYQFIFYPCDADGPESALPAAVYPVTPSSDGRLWVGTNARGLLAFSKDTESFLSYGGGGEARGGLGSDIILAVQEDALGGLWIGTRARGLYRYAPKTGSLTRVPLDPRLEVVWDVLADRSGAIWAATLGFGLYRIDPSSGKIDNFRFHPEDTRSLGSDTAWTVFEDRSGTIWVGTKDGGLNRYEPESDGFVRFYGAGDFSGDLASQTITAVLEDRSDRLWLGTASDGLRIWDRKSGAYVLCRHDPQDPESLGGDGVTSIFEDAGGVIWVGTALGGLNKCLVGRAKFEHYKHNPSDRRSISRNSVQALWEDPAGALWAGSKAGLERLDPATGAEKLANGSVLAIRGDPSGGIWLGTDGEGLVRFDPSTGRRKGFLAGDSRSGLLANKVNALRADASDPAVLWIGTQRGVNRLDTRSGRWQQFVRAPESPFSLVNPVVTDLLDDGAGSIWVGTRGGLSRLDKSTGRCENFVSRLEDPPGASVRNNTVNCLYQDPGEAIWVGTYSGLDRLDRKTGRWRNYAQKDGLGGEVVAAILGDAAGGLWVSTNRGLARFDPATERFTNFGLHDGLQGFIFNPRAAALGADGRMSFGGGNGINVFHPSEIKKDPVPPAVVWTAFYRNNVERERPRPPSAEQDIILSYKMGLITFVFAALSFAAPEMNSFAYKLEPLDADWIPLVPAHSVSFYNLHSGPYILRIKAANPDGVWNEEGLAIGLTVLTPFWKTWWFQIIVAAFLASGLLLAFRVRARIKAAPGVLGAGLDENIGTYGLTGREEEILRLVLRGARNKDIERELFISASTVRNHISNIYQKLGVRTRLELINRIGRDAQNSS